MILFGDLKLQYMSIKDEIDAAIKEVFDSGWFILGKKLEEFEKKFADYCGKRFGIGVASGTDAIIIALKAVGVKEGDEVITAVNTAIPTASAIVSAGARPVFVDCNENYLIDAEKIEAEITSKTKAIIPVHLYGNVCDMNKILEIAKKHNLYVIEDACQAHGAEYNGKKVPVGEMGCFSFYPTKNLGGYGDSGMVVVSDEKLAEKMKQLRNYGQTETYHAKTHGINSRLDEIQAAILLAKLKHLDKWNSRRIEIARDYEKTLRDIVLPAESKNKKHVFHLYVIRHKERDKLRKYLEENGIKTSIHYPIPLHLQEAYQYLGYKKGDFPVAERLAEEIISLPIYPELIDTQIEKISEIINKFVCSNN